MYSVFSSTILITICLFGRSSAVCTTTGNLGPCILEPLGATCQNGAGICIVGAAGGNDCCNDGVVTTTPFVPRPTTTKTTTASCVDLVNAVTGVSDCTRLSYLCNDSTYYATMTVQCPKTCGRCTNTTTNTTCVDLLNPSTGVSDCPSRASLCTNVLYNSVMRTQCPRTCGFCNSSVTSSTTSSSTTCADQINPSTGVSDCSSLTAYCTNALYSTIMRTQCPRTCGFC